MGKNRIQTFDGSKYDMWSIVAMAKCYYELSKVFTSNLGSDLPTQPSESKGLDFSGVASATNRVLAIELLFKAILVGRGAIVPKTHNLPSLFLELPQNVRLDIETMFDERIKNIPTNQHRTATYLFTLGNQYSEVDLAAAAHEAQSQPDDSLSGLLERNKDGFVDSRYLFQLAAIGEINFFNYEFLRLGVLYDVLSERLAEIKKERDTTLAYGQPFYKLKQSPFASQSYVFTGQGKFLPVTLNAKAEFQLQQDSATISPAS